MRANLNFLEVAPKVTLYMKNAVPKSNIRVSMWWFGIVLLLQDLDVILNVSLQFNWCQKRSDQLSVSDLKLKHSWVMQLDYDPKQTPASPILNPTIWVNKNNYSIRMCQSIPHSPRFVCIVYLFYNKLHHQLKTVIYIFSGYLCLILNICLSIQNIKVLLKHKNQINLKRLRYCMSDNTK